MRCAHCEQESTYRSLLRFRMDGGCRCAHCGNVFYIDPREARMRLWLPNLLLMVGVMLSVLVLLPFAIRNPWLLVIPVAAVVPMTAAIFHFRLAGIPTMTTVPSKNTWRRRCFNIGMIFFISGQFLSILSRPYVPKDDWSHYISITGFVIFILFIVAGFARSPRTDTAPPAR